MTTEGTPKKRGGDRRNTRSKVQADERARQALRLRSEGKTYQQIADTLGLSGEGAAYEAWKRGWQMAVKPDVEQTRANMLAMMERVVEAHMPKAIGEDGSDPDPRSAEVIRGYLDRAAKLLGVDAPQRVETTVTHFDGDGSDLDRRIAELAARFNRGQAGEITTDLGIPGTDEPAGT